MKKMDIAVIGGGPAGMSAAVSARQNGAENIIVLERDESLGGILQQCIHNGFGLHKFKEELTGPEYSQKYETQMEGMEIPYLLNTTVLSLSPDKIITAVNKADGIFQIQAGAIILATGCRERPRGALNIPGNRPAGVYSAGTAQKLVNIKGCMPGKAAVILGSGDIGLIMARRMTLEGAQVKAVCELMPYSGGLARNIEQCLNDFDIPLMLSHTVVEIHGDERLCGVTVSRVDGNLKPMMDHKKYIPCDTLLLSVGLIPENELAKTAGITLDPVTGGAVTDENRQTSVSGIFSCGNSLHVHDLVDYVSDEGEIAGRSAAEYIRGGDLQAAQIQIKPGSGIRYCVPRFLTGEKGTALYFRTDRIYENATVRLKDGERLIVSVKRRKMVPAQMQELRITDGAAAKIKGKAIFLELEEAYD
jgi:NADPH-dependent 2,4-dienoyl-CoA reductase/sulfur reductase-like enzyme